MGATGVSVSTLAGVPLLGGADAEALEALATDASPRRVLAGEWLIREGDDADDLFVVLRGRLRAVADADGDPRTLRVLGPGAAIGELGQHREVLVRGVGLEPFARVAEAEVLGDGEPEEDAAPLGHVSDAEPGPGRR